MKNHNITKEQLFDFYHNQKKSVREIGIIIGKDPKTISNYLKFFGINARPFSSFNFTKGSQARLGAVLSKETKEKIRTAHLGKKIPIETRMKMGSKGDKNSGWIDGRTPEHKRQRRTIEYKLWREAVFQRDDYTCVLCSKRGGNLNADHIKPFALFPELRTSISNGRTLCVGCHKKTDTFGRQKLNLLANTQKS